jgi:hypothetical protein
VFVGLGKKQNPFKEVVDVTEAPGLISVSIHRERLAAQSLHEEVRDDPAVAGLEARTIGVEDTDQVGVHTSIPVISHHKRLGIAFGFVVNRPRTHGVHMAPVLLSLGMLERIAIALRS